MYSNQHLVSLTGGLALLWLVLSGSFSPLLLGFGVVSCALVIWVVVRMGIVDGETMPVHLFTRLPRMVWAITCATLASNRDVALLLLRGGRDVAPSVRTIDFRARRPLTQAVIGNAITLTPGTLTLRVTDAGMTIHALTPGMLEGMEDTAMIRTLRGADDA